MWYFSIFTENTPTRSRQLRLNRIDPRRIKSRRNLAHRVVFLMRSGPLQTVTNTPSCLSRRINTLLGSSHDALRLGVARRKTRELHLSMVYIGITDLVISTCIVTRRGCLLGQHDGHRVFSLLRKKSGTSTGLNATIRHHSPSRKTITTSGSTT